MCGCGGEHGGNWPDVGGAMPARSHMVGKISTSSASVSLLARFLVDHGALIAKSPKRAPTPSKNARLGYTTSIPGGKGLCSVEIGRLVKGGEPDGTFTSRS